MRMPMSETWTVVHENVCKEPEVGVQVFGKRVPKLLYHHLLNRRKKTPWAGNVWWRYSGPVTCRGVTVFVDSIFSITKTSISRTNSGICGLTRLKSCFLTPEIPLLVRLIEVLVVNYRVHLLRTRINTRKRDRFQTCTNGRSASRNNSPSKTG